MNQIEEVRLMRETLTASEASELLGLSKWSVYELTRRKEIPHIKIGRRVLFRRESLLAWLSVRERDSIEVEPEQTVGGLRRLK